jgi:hypothetical protein
MRNTRFGQSTNSEIKVAKKILFRLFWCAHQFSNTKFINQYKVKGAMTPISNLITSPQSIILQRNRLCSVDWQNQTLSRMQDHRGSFTTLISKLVINNYFMTQQCDSPSTQAHQVLPRKKKSTILLEPFPLPRKGKTIASNSQLRSINYQS